MANLEGFDANGQEEFNGDFEPLPVGEYTALIQNSDKVETALVLTFEILDEKYKGRLIWDRLQLWHDNEKAVKIGQRKLTSICKCTGIMRPKDSTEFHNKVLTIGLKTREYEGKIYNDVTSYAVQGQTKAAQKEVEPEFRSKANSAKPPWQK